VREARLKMMQLYIKHQRMRTVSSHGKTNSTSISADVASSTERRATTCVTPIALYTKLDAESDQQVTVVGRLLIAWPRPPSSPGIVNSRPHLSNCLSHSAKVDVTWANFLRLEFGTKFQRDVGPYPYRWRYHNLLKI